MACTNLTVTSPAKSVTLSNIGFGSPDQRYTVCTTAANVDVAWIWFDYTITNPTASNVINGSISFIMPGNGFPSSATFSVMTSTATGTMKVNCQQGTYTAGNWTGANATATVT